MIFNIELPYALNKTRSGTGSESGSIQEAKKHRSSSIYSFSTDILYHFSSDWGFHEKFCRKVFEKNFRENCDTFCKSFRFSERSKKCFRPNPTQSSLPDSNLASGKEQGPSSWGEVLLSKIKTLKIRRI
jgi:hypothetical protein